MTVDREAWLRWRRTGITATDIAGIIGLSKWSSLYSVWAAKVGLLPEVEVTDAMEFGSRAERMVGEWFTDRTGLYVTGEQTWCTHPDDPACLATVDGFVVESRSSTPADALGGFEIKTTTDTAAEWDVQIPNHVMCQIQWQMYVTGMPRTWLATLHLGFRVQFEVRVVERDDADIALLVAAATAFWTDHVLTGIAPETDGTDATTTALRAAWPGDGDLDPLEADNTLTIVCTRINAIKARIKEAEESLAVEENFLRAALGDRTALTHGLDKKGRPVVLCTWKPSTRTGFDTKGLKAAEPEIAAKYTTTTPTRTLLVKPNKGE